MGPLRRNILANQFVNDLRKNNTKTSPSPPEKNGEFDYNLPITTTYLKHMRTLGYTDEDALKFERYVSDIFTYNSFIFNNFIQLRPIAIVLHSFITDLLNKMYT